MVSTYYKGVDWLLTKEPRPAQLEALARSYTGIAYRNTQHDDMAPRIMRPGGGPARGYGFYMEMRVGKTPTWLNEYLLFKRDFSFKRGLVFAPNRYKATWALEAAKFGLTEPLLVFDSSKKKEITKFIEGMEGLVFINWEAMAHPALCELLEPWVDEDTFVGGDEAIFIKNKESLFFKNSVILTRAAGAVRPMTGKPIVQGPHDLYSQFRWMQHLNGTEYLQFRNTYCIRGGFKGKQVVGVKNEVQLKELMDRCMFYARRRDWATFFEPEQVVRRVSMTEEQKAAYATMEEEFMVWLDTGAGVSVEQIITKHQKLQQISSGFFLDEYGNAHDIIPAAKNPKILDLKYTLENEIQGKTIVIVERSHSIDVLIEELAEYNPAVIRGQMKTGEADVQKFRFNNDAACRVIIGQGSAIKYGHTLMGLPEDRCETTYYFENGYSLDTRAQTMERNQGEGQVDPTVIFDPVCSPIEEIIAGALQRKEDIAATILGYYKGTRGRDHAPETVEW